MTSGALNFTLGMQANQFLNTLNVSSGKLIGFLGVAEGIKTAFSKMWGAIDQGGKLNDLAASANLSVKTLYQLQRAFEEVGASADSVPSIINRLRRTLGGGDQNGLLAQLGLDPQKLAGLDPGAQFESIAAALARINVNARSQAAQKLFGREGAATAMQIANSGNDFADAMKRAESDAQIWQRVAKTFDDIGDKVMSLTRHIETMWAQVTGAFIQAFNEGKLAEVITDVIATAFQAGLSVVPAMFVKLGEVLLRTFQGPLAYLQAGLEYTINEFIGQSQQQRGARRLAREALGMRPEDDPFSFQNILKERLAEGVKFNLGNGEFGMNEISASANDFLKRSFSNAGVLLSDLSNRLGAYVGRLPQSAGAAAAGAGGAGLGFDKANRPDVTNLEKMGFVFNGKGTTESDFTRMTADNTRKTTELLKITNQVLSDIAPLLKLVNANL